MSSQVAHNAFSHNISLTFSLSSVSKSDTLNQPKRTTPSTVPLYNTIMFNQNVATIILDIVKIMIALLAL
jgi:hypothetical protein